MTAPPAPSPWFTRLRTPDRAAARAVLFPQAGGGAYALAGLVPLLPPDIEVLSLALPGRDRRFGEPARTDPATVLDETDAVLRSLPPLPTLLFGCSVGALLAARAAARLPDLCSALVVASQLPGAHHRRPLHATGTAELTQVLTDAGDTPANVLADPDFAASLLDRLDADLRLGEAAESAFDDVVCDAPTLVVGGLSDPFVSPGLLPGWTAHTRSTCTLLTLPGGHFSFLEPANRPLVSAVLNAVSGGGPGRV